jgi:hypothetical protein
MSETRQLKQSMRFRIPEIEKTFVQVAIDVHVVIVLDAIIPVPDLPGFLIQSHDLHGPLPDVRIEDNENRLTVLDSVAAEAAKLTAVAKVRDDLAAIFPGCIFLPHTLLDAGVLVGLSFNGRTILAEAPSFWEAYHRLIRRCVRQLL